MLTDPIRRFGDFLVSLGLVTEGQVQEALALQPLTGNRVGEALLSLGYLTRAQLQRALSMAVQSGSPVVLDRPPLGEILVGLRYADDSQIEAGLASQQKTGQRLGETLVSQGVIDHQQLYEALGLQQRMATPLPEPERLSTTELRSASGKRVVFIDDSEIALALIGEALTAQGFEVTTFSDPFLALEQLDVLKPDLVITDLDMPGLDGGEVCRRLKSSPSSALPVIILSAHDAELLKVKGLRDGADDYVSKSVSMHELGARVESVLRRTRETDRVRRLFARYTSDAVVEEILRGGGEVVLTGERREVTVLFADLRDFTAFAEARPPEDVMRFLNEVLGRLADVVLERGGTLDKFLGDGLMAVWGAPVRRDDDLQQAVDAARAMHAALDAFNAGRSEHFQLGIGINTGPVLAGSLGSERRTDYTCIGDTVNVASRLCSLAGPGETLLGEGTAQGLSGRTEPLPPVKLKGKAHEVPLFRLVR